MKTLQAGVHSSQSGEVCLMEAVSVLAGEVFSDTPETTCPVLATFGRSLNDAMPSDETRSLLIPLIPLLIGTRDTEEREQARAFFLADRAVRLFAPLALDAAGLTDHAQMLRNMPSIVDTETASTGAREARAVAESAEASAWAAEATRASAWAATRATGVARSATAAWAAEAAKDWEVAVAVFREAIAL